jgi:DNA-binding response OmpR family regulator
VGAGEILKANTPRRVLVVEDETLLRIDISEHLRACGYEVLEASSAEEATNTITGMHVDLMFTDVQMPGSIDGLDLVQWVLVTRPSVKIIVASGIPDMRRKLTALCAEAHFFDKPYAVEAVEARISAALRGA